MAYEPSIRVYADATAIARRLESIVGRLNDMPRRKAAAIDRTVRRGILDNMRTLSFGGGVRTPGGHDVRWIQARHPYTKRIRRAYFDDPGAGTFPILKLTGRLQNNIAKGSFRTSQRSIRYRVPASIEDLVRVHQRGGRPLPSRSRSKPPADLRIPPRQMLLWSDRMARDVMDIAKDDLKRGGR